MNSDKSHPPTTTAATAAQPRWVTGAHRQLSCPTVYQQWLYLPLCGGEPYCCLDSPLWFTWLETATTFRFHTTATVPVAHGYSRPAVAVSLRKEQRRRGSFWYAYLRKGGQLLKRYAGRSQALTTSRLDEVAMDLNLG